MFNKYYIILVLLIGLSQTSKSQTTAIPDVNFEQALIDLGIDSDATINGGVLTSDIIEVTKLFITHKAINDLTGIEGFTNLLELTCYSNNLQNLSLSKNLKLTNLHCSNNDLQNIDLSKNASLKYLQCDNNNLTNLDITNNKELIGISCGSNKLNSIDLMNNTKLESLYCYNNNIENLDLSKNTSLTKLTCSQNQLETLDLTYNILLSEIICSINKIAEIQVGHLANLNSLIIGGNELTNLEVTNNINLIKLHCGGNFITELDLSKNELINDISCYNNELNSLNVKNGMNSYMLYFSATNNSELDCIQVDNEIQANNGAVPYNRWRIDSFVSYAENCKSTLEVDSEVLQKSVRIFPNPVNDMLGIESKTLQVTKVEIYSVLGKKVKEITSNFSNIHISKLPSGLYLTKVYSEKGTMGTKIIKL